MIERKVTPYWLATRYDVPLDELASLNTGWSAKAVDHGLRLPVGTVVWLPRGTLERVAGRTRGAVGDGVHHVVRPGDTLSTVAAAVYQLAMRDELLPRFSADQMPEPPGGQ